MLQFYHAVRQILNGTRAMSDEIKYKTICFGVALIHLLFTIVFGMQHIMPLFLYNIAITIFYSFHGFVTIKKKQYIFIYISSLTEVLFHSGFASILLGWNWGFMIYTIALVPVAFYLAYTFTDYRGSIVSPVFSSTIVIVYYILVQVICKQTVPLYQGKYPSSMPGIFYYFNTMVTFAMLLIFSTLFALEIRYMQRRLEQENHALGEIARLDPLTHLLNRRSMNTCMRQIMEQAVKSEHTFCLIMADIDDFKVVNDTYGHECGDMVIIEISNIISDIVREDDYVCRWGGEEILILIQADLAAATKVAERICQGIASKKISYKEKEIQVTITLGLSAYQEGASIRSLIEKADQNLYRGKNNGKNQVVV